MISEKLPLARTPVAHCIWVEQRVPPGILCFEFLTAKMRDAHGTCIHWGKLEKQIFRMV